MYLSRPGYNHFSRLFSLGSSVMLSRLSWPGYSRVIQTFRLDMVVLSKLWWPTTMSYWRYRRFCNVRLSHVKCRRSQHLVIGTKPSWMDPWLLNPTESPSLQNLTKCNKVAGWCRISLIVTTVTSYQKPRYNRALLIINYGYWTLVNVSVITG